MDKEEIKKKILEVYNKINENNPDKLDIEKAAKNNPDPSIKEFLDEFNQSYFKKDIDVILDKVEKKEEIKEKEETLEPEDLEDPVINKMILEKIEKKVQAILNDMNLELYKNKKIDLENVLINDVIENIIDVEINSFRENLIAKYIIRLVSKEYDELEIKKKNRRKELLRDLLNKILPEVKEFFEKYNYNKLRSMSLFQKKNIIKIFLHTLDKKFIKKQKNEKKVNNQEYKYLRSKVRDFIIRKYNEILSKKYE